jgi:hypothetical protein
MEEGEGEQQPREKRSYKTKNQVQIMLAEMEHQICSGKTDHEISIGLSMIESIQCLVAEAAALL